MTTENAPIRYAIILRRIVIHQRNLERRRRQQMKHKQAAAASSTNGVINNNHSQFCYQYTLLSHCLTLVSASGGGRARRCCHNCKFFCHLLLLVDVIVVQYCHWVPPDRERVRTPRVSAGQPGTSWRYHWSCSCSLPGSGRRLKDMGRYWEIKKT